MTRRFWVVVGVCLRITIVIILFIGFWPMIERALEPFERTNEQATH
jgi:hypothetical protein